MKLFISWSGAESKELGQAFRSWIPSVIQAVQPYFTPDDIEKGARWNSEISKELEASNLGIICLTRQNLEKPWLMFEAGALSKSVEESSLCPILFGIDSSDLSGPLTHFQASQFNKSDIRSLVENINKKCGDLKLADNVLSDVFEMWWPRLEKSVSSINEKYVDSSVDHDESVRSDRDLLEEILALSRMKSADSTGRSWASRRPRRIVPAAITDLGILYKDLLASVEIGMVESKSLRHEILSLSRPIIHVLKNSDHEDLDLVALIEALEEITEELKKAEDDGEDVPF